MKRLAVVTPADMASLQALVAASLAPLHFLAGGTDMLTAGRLPEVGLLVDLSRVGGMAFIETEGPDIRIGAATTVGALAEHEGLGTKFRALRDAAAQCGSVQIRNRATIGGNVANGAPAADLVPVLLAADARLGVLRQDGRRHEVKVAGFAAQPGELILDVVVPGTSLLSKSAFVKLGPRRELAISRLNLALVAELRDGRFGRARFAAGAIGPTPRRLRLAEAAVTGRELEGSMLRDLVDALTAEVDAAIPGRASQVYKRRAICGLGLDLIARVAGISSRDRLFQDALG